MDDDHQGRVRHLAPMVLERKSRPWGQGLVRKLEIVPFSRSAPSLARGGYVHHHRNASFIPATKVRGAPA
jgi:hypothetical protein